MAYSPGDKIFAKVKGHPHWPSRINLLPPDVSIPKGKYPIFFYGTHEVYVAFLNYSLFSYFLAPKDIFPYEKFKHKFAIPRNKPLFQAGLREIEEDPDVLLYGKDPQSEEFLARFYKFTRDTATSQPQASVDSTPQSAITQSGKRSNAGSPTDESLVDGTTPSARPRRLASLRLRIRNDGNGLKFSPAHESPLSSISPSTPESSGTVEAKRPVEVTSTATVTTSTDPLRITIKQLSTSPSIVASTTAITNSGLVVPSRPMFSVAPSPNTGLIGVGADSNGNTARKKSTAVVTPLRRDHAPTLPEVSDDSAAVSTPSTDAETPSSRTPPSDSRVTLAPNREKSEKRRTERSTKLKHSHGDRKERRHRTNVSKRSGSVTTTTTPVSEQDSSSTQSPWPPSDCGKNVSCDS
ncbi:unnamed protein product [Echinostoma caproni]|uniref:PWWP domain-containing protein n=1 Tax=Echinostoma caproni TaxID=27848 RepID=A0A183AQH7_9TREM|nr:unnamed protein product [Echinostoma caproni]